MRMSRRGLVIALGLTGMLCGGTVALGAAALPYYDTFETYTDGVNLDGAPNWYTNTAGGSAVCQTTNVLQGSKGCTTSLSDLTLDVDEAQGNYSNVWTQIYVKPRLYDDAGGSLRPAAPSNDTSVAFYVNTDSEVVAYSNNTWVTVATINTTDWIALSVHSDYANAEWDIYKSDDGTFGTVQTKLNTLPLAMNAAYVGSELTEMTIEGVATLDAVAMAPDNDAVSADGTNLMVYAKNVLANYNENVGMFAHTYSVLAATALGDELGDDLLAVLADDDTVAIWDTAQHIYAADSTEPSGWDTTFAAGLALANAYCNPGTGMWIAKNVPGALLIFSDYDSLTSFPKDIHGSDQGGGGLNRLVLDLPTQSQQAMDGLGLTGEPGDRLWLPERGGKMLYWQGSGWYDSGSGSTLRLNPGEVFWFFDASSGTGTWNVADAQ